MYVWMDGTSKTPKRDPAKTSIKTYSWRPFGDVFCSFVWRGTRMFELVCMFGFEHLNTRPSPNLHENGLLETVWGRFLLFRVGGYTEPADPRKKLSVLEHQGHTYKHTNIQTYLTIDQFRY